MSDYISQREFARHIGRSHVWVNRLVKEGRLPADDRGRIPLKEGLDAYEMSQQPGDDFRREVAAAQRKEYAAKSAAKKTAAKKAATKKTAAKKSTVAKKTPAKKEVPAPTPQQYDDLPTPSSGMTVAKVNEQFNRARLAEKTYQAKLKELEYKEASGELITREAVEADAEKIGAEVRERLMSVPPRVAGLCEDKPAREIERIVEEAINEALSALSRTRFKGNK